MIQVTLEYLVPWDWPRVFPAWQWFWNPKASIKSRGGYRAAEASIRILGAAARVSIQWKLP